LLPLMVWAPVSDFLDGFFARRYYWTSAFGASFDLCADGLFFLACFLRFWLTGVLPTVWFTLILLGCAPELAAQGVFLFRRRRGVGSTGRVWGKILGGYSYLCVLGIALGLFPVALVFGLVVLELWANGMDLRDALRSGSPA